MARGGQMVRRLMFALCLGVISGAASAQLAGYSDPFQFCRVVVNADNDGEAGMRDPRYLGNNPPMELQSIDHGNFVWRCMDGKVLVCAMGASGRGCIRWSTSTNPTPNLRNFCAKNSNGFVPNAANDTPYAWVCRGGLPVRDLSMPMKFDRRGYYAESWREVTRGTR
jgi:hypothetical protein